MLLAMLEVVLPSICMIKVWWIAYSTETLIWIAFLKSQLSFLLLYLLSYLSNFITCINGSFASRHCSSDQKPLLSTFIAFKSSQHFLWGEISSVHFTYSEQLLQIHFIAFSVIISNFQKYLSQNISEIILLDWSWMSGKFAEYVFHHRLWPSISCEGYPLFSLVTV